MYDVGTKQASGQRDDTEMNINKNAAHLGVVVEGSACFDISGAAPGANSRDMNGRSTTVAAPQPATSTTRPFMTSCLPFSRHSRYAMASHVALPAGAAAQVNVPSLRPSARTHAQALPLPGIHPSTWRIEN